MITRVRTVTVYVRDQDRAVTFYTDMLGFEVRVDQPMGDGQRWIELAPPGADTVIVPFTPQGTGSQGMEGRIGGFSGLVFACTDIARTFRDLSGRGVKFTQEPKQESWGAMAQFHDVDGNVFVLVEERKEGGA